MKLRATRFSLLFLPSQETDQCVVAALKSSALASIAWPRLAPAAALRGDRGRPRLFSSLVLPGLLACSFILLVLPTPALAVQVHGGAEGLVSHQIGHLLFVTGMGYLLWRIRRRHLHSPGWRSFRLFLCCIILWNITTITGHWLDKVIPPDHFILHRGIISAFKVNHPLDLLFYATRLDHFLLVPAFLFLLLALHRWSRHA